MFWAIQKPKNYCGTKSEQWQTTDGPNKSQRRCHHDGGRPSARWIKGISENVADRNGRTEKNNDCKSEYVSDIKKPISTNCTYKSILFCFYVRIGEINVCANFNIALPASTWSFIPFHLAMYVYNPMLSLFAFHHFPVHFLVSTLLSPVVTVCTSRFNYQ